MKKVVLNNKLRIIGSGAFSGCKSISTIDIPSNVVIVSYTALPPYYGRHYNIVSMVAGTDNQENNSAAESNLAVRVPGPARKTGHLPPL